MSAWMISDAHADFIATAYLQFVDASADPQAIGRALLEENARSLHARYEERHGCAREGREQAAAYVYRRWTGNIDRENLNKQARCAAYQCCEHGEAWTASESGRRIAELIACSGGDECALSDFYPWGIDNHPDDAPPADDREATIIVLQLASPKRADAGKPIALQLGTNDLDLFAWVDQPTLH